MQGKKLPAGRYSLWTIPNEKSWKVILNSFIPPWGIDHNSEAARTPETDVLMVEAPALLKENVVEQFTIDLQKLDSGYVLLFKWDKTEVPVPFSAIAPSDK